MNKPKDVVYPRLEDQIQRFSVIPKNYQLSEIRKETGGFNPHNKLNKSDFEVSSTNLHDNKEVPLKRIVKYSHQGKREFIK